MFKTVPGIGSLQTLRPFTANPRQSSLGPDPRSLQAKRPISGYAHRESPQQALLRFKKIIGENESAILLQKKVIQQAPTYYNEHPALKDRVIAMAEREIRQRHQCIEELHKKMNHLQEDPS